MDGPFKAARFCNPQGTAFLNDDIFFVADTGNHCVRMVSAEESAVMMTVKHDVNFTRTWERLFVDEIGL